MHVPNHVTIYPLLTCQPRLSHFALCRSNFFDYLSSLEKAHMPLLHFVSAVGFVTSAANRKGNMSSSTSVSHHPPSQFATDDEGLRWRLCAGAAVLNSKNELLIGERIGKPGSWQAPQGGVDGGSAPESVSEAAIRELYEEVGLEHGKHVLLEHLDEESSPAKCRYTTEGTGSWLEKAGFAGQELNWVVFRCCDPVLERDPSLVCDLSGRNGETPEFSAVRWESFDKVLAGIWEAKARPYQVLRESCAPIVTRWEQRCADFDLSGGWLRDAARSVDVVETLVARGLPEETAIDRATARYYQYWEKYTTKFEWMVTTSESETSLPRRKLHYPLGAFAEAYLGASTVFGGTDGGTVPRYCSYLPDPEADGGVAHVTLSDTRRGREESWRRLKAGDLLLRRTFTPKGTTDRIVSTEVFSMC